MLGGKSLYPWGEEVTATANDKIKFATYLRDGEERDRLCHEPVL
jgi:hypothetical protein